MSLICLHNDLQMTQLSDGSVLLLFLIGYGPERPDGATDIPSVLLLPEAASLTTFKDQQLTVIIIYIPICWVLSEASKVKLSTCTLISQSLSGPMSDVFCVRRADNARSKKLTGFRRRS